MIEVQFHKIDSRAQEPRNAYGDDAGWDLFVLEDTHIPNGGGIDVRSGITVAIPQGYFGRIVGRSSTFRRRGLMVIEGIIDAGFRGELFSYVYFPFNPWMTTRYNATPASAGNQMATMLRAGESVAQLIIQPVPSANFVERAMLPESQRGEKGFGSSGH